MFGGATGDTGKYTITGDTYLFECPSRKWKRLEPKGSQPTQRAAHAATSVEMLQLVIYGGATGGGGLAPDDLYLLDLRSGEEECNWIVVPVVGTTPGRRYGHSLVFSKPYLLVFGGNTGNDAVNDVWCLNVEKAPFFWVKLECKGDLPPVRVYHSAALCATGTANGMMVTFGGRTADQSALNDTWGLRRHRDGRWDWVKAPYKPTNEPPTARYQHSTIFLGSLMLVVGGRTNNVGESVPFEVYDADSSEWSRFPSIQRFRHACWTLDNILFVYGGFEQESPNIPTETIAKADLSKYFQSNAYLSKYLASIQPNSGTTGGYGKVDQQGSQLGGTGKGTTLGMNSDNMMAIEGQDGKNMTNKTITNPFMNKTVRLSDQAVISYTPDEDPNNLIKMIPINKLEEESKKLGAGFQDPNRNANQTALYYENLSAPFISSLLLPRDWYPPSDYKFTFKRDTMIKLIEEVQKIFEQTPSLLRLRPPMKIFGSIHGQFAGLMKFFELFKSPSEVHNEGDIEGFDYLFLGNYVDRGKYSLETIFLLLALKLKYPDQLHLLRGAHEDRKVNKLCGFAEECEKRLGEDINDPGSIYQRLNKLFDYMPLAALVADKLLCVHSGIGNTLKSIQEIDNIYRPTEVVKEPSTSAQSILLDLMWSDPLLSENENLSMSEEKRDIFGSNLIPQKFTQDRLSKFMKDNNLHMIIRSHEIVQEGFEPSPSGNFATITSVTDYMGKYQNAAAIAIIRKNNEIQPRIINTQLNSMEDEIAKRAGMGKSMGGNNMTQGRYNNMQGSKMDTEDPSKKRPATPPRMNTKTGKK
eukprot:CAMPEP_0176424724 /NCGR_PEP_ID=MMETSP0127-20121128/10992_1 /TAXON_ID=938130 /ORGANISM="Platyophrya macrostoma, Strain WH" /LENGTH=808 /DNA_ID=CAMNT_0017805805 /DNA_START=70 /DNA_END=2496 /DNA_ORIENTATION=+